MVYKDADTDDIEVLIDIYNSAFCDDYLKYGQCPAYGRTRESMEQSLKKYPKVIAYEGGRAVGVISYGAEGPGKYYIGCLGVKKEEQGRGIGTSLMKYFMNGHPDWKEITLVTPKDKESNVRFYTGRFGFEITGERVDGDVTVLLFRLSRQAADLAKSVISGE
ncbi:MAG: GNAT family N-acetyltransferase [Firmicutes bacterium]|nr:GNAT family N-acetyltransferase [Bacillota bacterium]